MALLQTERLRISALGLGDADFILRLVNDPDWLRFIGDRGVHDIDSACRYLREGPLAMYDRHGFGLYRVDRRSDGVAIGMCGLLLRPTLPHADIGYALLPEHRGQGYAREAARAVLEYGNTVLGLQPIAAITALDNTRSISLLQQLGLQHRGEIRLGAEDEVLGWFVQA
ncbi:MAG TPA: GNAT family N-acetyltransferase [Arenimonas sp.]|nr:GNAT family N-acetyltransferase [Arenimonas sp.]